MGFNLGKTLKKAVKSVSKPLSQVTTAVGKIAQGKISEGVGDIAQTGLSSGLDAVTGGNKGLVDKVSGGALTAAENAARGNTKDIARVGLTAGAVAVGGPMAGLAVNQAFASGANPLQAAMAGATGMEGSSMSWLTDATSFLNNPAVSSLAGNLLGNNKPSSPPQVVASAPSVPQVIYAPAPVPQTASTAMDKKTMMYIGGGFLALILLILMGRGKK